MENTKAELIGIEGYFVTPDSRIFSSKKGGLCELRLRTTSRGYRTIGFWCSGKKIFRSVHRLVAQSFLPNPQALPEVNHINGNKSDNRVENLEWISKSDNHRHAYKLGLMSRRGTKNSQVVIDDRIAKEIVLLTKDMSCAAVSRKLGIGVHIVEGVKKGKAWGHVTGVQREAMRV